MRALPSPHTDSASSNAAYVSQDHQDGPSSDLVSATERLQLFLPAAALSRSDGSRPKAGLFILDEAVY